MLKRMKTAKKLKKGDSYISHYGRFAFPSKFWHKI
ncbi:hypothetical protein ING2E5B_1782 [Fermentimonas caenicola]|uniref:Uncharacterized protein n=1 Tax=Fermentimonas caenicola TaxID=1562970 RepID=A0A098C278_9BACT|nr:hypothetical protein ING2E5B_1782 [Fermentimonas caenicola]